MTGRVAVMQNAPKPAARSKPRVPPKPKPRARAPGNATGTSDAPNAASPGAEESETALTPEQVNERLAEEVAQLTGLVSESQTSLHNMLQVGLSVVYLVVTRTLFTT